MKNRSTAKQFRHPDSFHYRQAEAVTTTWSPRDLFKPWKLWNQGPQVWDLGAFPLPRKILLEILKRVGPRPGNVRLVCRDWCAIFDAHATKISIPRRAVLYKSVRPEGYEDFSMLEIGKKFPMLTEINAMGMSQFDARELATINRITALDLSSTGLSDYILEELAPLINLKSLNVSGNRITNRGFDMVCRSFPLLTHLNISFNKHLDQPQWPETGFQHLISLAVDEVPQLALSRLTRLRLLEVRKVQTLDDARCLFEMLPLSLTHLHVVGTCSCSDWVNHKIDLSPLSALTNLHHLQVVYDLTHPTKSLHGHKLIRSDDDNLNFLLNLKHLEHLTLRWMELREHGFACFSHLNKLTHLDLEESRFRQEDVSTLARLTRLQSLSLRRTSVDNKGLQNLLSLRELRFLNLNMTKVTPQACEAASQRLPKLRELCAWKS